jgi:opine dehydrogenase
MKVAVLGAGSGGQALAGDLTLAGHEVRLAAVKEHANSIQIIKSCGGLYIDGTTSGSHATGFARIPVVTTDIAEAVKDAAVVMVVIPAFGQEVYMRELVRHAAPGQIVVFNPGKFGALTFARLLREAGREGELTVGETASLIYAAKPRKFDQIYIKAIKAELMFAALPADRTAKTLQVVNQLFPQFIPADNVLATSIDDSSLVLHTVSTLMNASRIEQMGPYRNAYYDVTPAVGRTMEVIDKERIAVSRAFGNFSIPFLLMLRFRYDAAGQSLYEALKQVKAYQIQMAPENLQHRYITEEVPYGLVPLTELARLAGVPTPGMDAIIQMASMANGVDYRKTGRNVMNLGLAGLDTKKIVQYVAPGWEGYSYS